MNCSILVAVSGEPGGEWEVDLRRTSKWFREGNSGDWAIRLNIPSGLLAEVLTDPEGQETVGISYKLELYIKVGARMKEPLVDRLIHTPSPLWLIKTMFAPRFAEHVFLRRTEFWQTLRGKLTATG